MSASPGPWVIRLAEAPPDARLVGGKASQLGLAVRANLPVPEGFVVPAAVLDDVLRRGGMAKEVEAYTRALAAAAAGQASPEVGAALVRQGLDLGSRIPKAPLPPGLAEALEAAWIQTFPEGARVAVRSSALQEDSEGASFAGQHETVLGVKSPSALLTALRRCWASLFSEASLRYRLARAAEGGWGMAVVVQRLVSPRASGVLFTINPMNGSRREMILEAGWGLGEAYVSGQASADSYVVARPLSPRRDVPLNVLHQVIVTKEKKLVAGPGDEPVWAPVEAALQSRSTLSPEEIEAIGRLGLATERLFGAARDVEWALDAAGVQTCLQARPITTDVAPDTHRRRQDVLWTSRFSGERWTGVASPLGWSIIAPILHHFVYFEEAAASHLGGSLPTRLYRGLPYINITIFRHLLFKLPGSPPPQFMLEFFPREEQAEILSAPWIWPDVGMFAAILRQVYREKRWERFAWQPLSNHRVWDAFLPTFEARIAALPAAPATLEDCRGAAARARALIVDYIGIHVTSLAFASIFYQILDVLVRRWAGRADPALLSALVTQTRGNKTVETNRALWELARLVEDAPEVAHALTEGDAIPSPEALRALPGGEAFTAALASFLDRFGHRSVASWEMFSPRWADDPTLPLGVLRGWLEAGLSRDPQAIEAHSGARREEAEEEILSALRRMAPRGRQALRLRLFQGVLSLARSYSLLRENQRFYFDKLLYKAKRIYLRQGELMAEAGLLTRGEDIVHLTQEEVDELRDGHLPPGDAAALIADRAQAQRDDERAQHPAFLRGEEQCLDATPTSGRTLSGLGISPGRITGKVRIIRSLAEGLKLRRGDILVTRATDPGWTPLFLTAGGLIMELGSVLSHGAVVAREYHLPAVVNISDATHRLKDGQTITLDGDRGIIFLH